MNTRLLILSLICVCCIGCAMPLPSAGPGFFITNATEGISANNGVPLNKTGEACAINILGIASVGDASLSEAMQKARLTQTATVDRTYFGVLGVFAKACTVVSGN